MKIKVILLFLFMFFNVVSIFAYVIYPKAVLSIDRKEMETGDVVNAIVEITIPEFSKLLQTEKDIYIEGWDIQDFYFKQDLLDDCKFILDLSVTTFNPKSNNILKIKLSYVNKEDFFNDSFFCEKFYFFSNAINIKVNSILPNYERTEIFDIKSMKEMNIPILFYILCLLFILFVFFVVYRNILVLKVRKNFKFNFSPREKAIRDLNNIYNTKTKQVCFSDISDKYYLMSRILKCFILEEFGIQNKEMTTTELVCFLSKETNAFYKNYSDIVNLFKILDNVKYSVKTLSLKEFFYMFNKTKHIIKNLSVNIEKY